MPRLRALARVAAALGFLWFSIPAPAAASVHAIAEVDKIDLTGALEICESAADLDVAAVAAGACPFEPATPQRLARGFTDSAFWLRLSLANTGAAPVERLLQAGNRRLERVSFYENAPEGGWRRVDSGLAVPLAERPYVTPDPILPLRLEPGQTRTFLIRAASRTSINLTSTLWRNRIYDDARNRYELEHMAAFGGLLVAAMFSLLMAFANYSSPWSNRANLFLTAMLLCRALFNAANAGLLPIYALSSTQAYDLRVQAVSLGLCSIFYTLFILHFVDARKNHRFWHRALWATMVAVYVETVWAVAIDYRRAFQLLALSALVALAFSSALLFRAWRDKLPAAGYLLVSNSINLLAVGHRIALGFGGGFYNDALQFAYSWSFMLTAPLLPLGIALHERAMHRALIKAREENVARLEFLAQMSHELRTPLDTILGNAQLLSRPGTSPALHKEGLAAIENSGRRLLRMIDDILDHARGLAGRLAFRPAPVDWQVFLRGVEMNAKILAARQGNAFVLRQEGPRLQKVLLDEGRVRQILDNLLVNAARHTRHGRIELLCQARRETGGYRLDLSVTDSGEGVAPEDIERIFLPFERGGDKSARRGDKGLGMGLTISRQLAEMMGGRLSVSSAPGAGACFRLQIGTTAAEDAPQTAAVSGVAAASRKKLLLVDDEDDNRRVLATLLRDGGFVVLEADSGRAATAALAANDVDLVITDQFMADGDGWTVLRATRRLRPDAAAVSISAAPLAPPAGMDARFDLSFLKPLDHAALLQGVADLLGLDLLGSDLLGLDLLGLDLSGAEASPPPAPNALATRPDAAAMAELRRLIANGQVSEIIAWAEARRRLQPGCAPFADEVGAAARDLDFTTLNALAQTERA